MAAMRLDWTDLRVFLHVCEAGSMTAAAERCHLTLAAVSARMRGLEHASGTPLLHRHARGVSPTPAGDVLAGHARRIFALVQQLEGDLRPAPHGRARHGVLLANSSALARPLAHALASHADAQRALLVRESPSEATVQALRAGTADVGIVSDAVDTRGLLVRPLGPDPLVLVAAPAHPLAARASVRFAQLLSQPWVAWGEQSALAAHLQLRALAAGRRIDARFTYPRAGGVLRLVAQGLGISVLPAVVARRHGDPAIACVPLEDDWARRGLLLCRAEGSAAWTEDLAEAVARGWAAPAP